MIVVLCGAEGAAAQREWAARQDVTELHAVGFYPTAEGRGIVVHTRSEQDVAMHFKPDVVVGGTPGVWAEAPRPSMRPLMQAAAKYVQETKPRRGRPPKAKMNGHPV